MNRIPSQIIIDVIKAEMNLPNDTIWIREQNKKIPNDEDLYVIVGMVDARPMSSNSRIYDETVDAVVVTNEEVSVQMLENIQIDIFARSNESILRRWEIIAALTSIRSRQAQELNEFRIARLPKSFVNTSVAEGGSQLARYSLTFGVYSWYKKTRTLSTTSGDYYDDFDTRVDDAKTIGQPDGLIEFNIGA